MRSSILRCRLLVLMVLLQLPLLGCGEEKKVEAPPDLPQGPPAELSPLPPSFEGYGYEARACGFDLDDDGLVGEPEDDCNVCDGVTTDPDGDGVDEDLVYVSCGTGADAFGCGTAESPCNSIAYAWSSVVDGPGNGAEDIVCFRGTCSGERLAPAFGGVPGHWLKPASGSEGRDWQFPKDPAMLVGWDTDDDGEYPPFDTDETAVLDGEEGTRAFVLGEEHDYVELAHFTVADYGRFTRGKDLGWLSFEPEGDVLSHVYVHDQELLGINMERAADRKVSAIYLGTDSLRLHWLNFSNLLVRDNGGAFALGASPGVEPELGPMRWQHITRTAHSCDFDRCGRDANTLGFAFAGYLTGLEILDSAWFANVAHWRPKDTGGPPGAAFVIAGRYTQDWLIRKNLIIDHKNGLIVRGSSSAVYQETVPRPVDGVVFDRNFFLNTYPEWNFGDLGVDLRGGDTAEEPVGSVRITNNVLATTADWDACIWMQVGNDFVAPSGEILLAGNTCVGTIDRYAAIVVGNPVGKDQALVQENVTLQNNLVAGVGQGNANLLATYRPSQWASGGNVFDPEGFFRWRGQGAADLASFQEMSQADAGSKSCVPTFVRPGRDYHLQPTDTCARDSGLEGIDLLFDFDGEARGVGEGWDVGADEVKVSEETAPTP